MTRVRRGHARKDAGVRLSNAGAETRRRPHVVLIVSLGVLGIAPHLRNYDVQVAVQYTQKKGGLLDGATSILYFVSFICVLTCGRP